MSKDREEKRELWASVEGVKHSSIVGGGSMLLGADGRCVGQVMLLNVGDDRKAFEEEVTRQLSVHPLLVDALQGLADFVQQDVGMEPLTGSDVPGEHALGVALEALALAEAGYEQR